MCIVWPPVAILKYASRWIANLEERGVSHWLDDKDRMEACERVLLALHDGILWRDISEGGSPNRPIEWSQRRVATAAEAYTALDKAISESKLIK